MKNTKAKQWEKISEGLVSYNQIRRIQEMKQPIMLIALAVGSTTVGSSVDVVRKGNKYYVYNNINPTNNRKPYTYLSCAVRCAVKEYKAVLATYKWRMVKTTTP